MTQWVRIGVKNQNVENTANIISINILISFYLHLLKLFKSLVLSLRENVFFLISNANKCIKKKKKKKKKNS